MPAYLPQTKIIQEKLETIKNTGVLDLSEKKLTLEEIKDIAGIIKSGDPQIKWLKLTSFCQIDHVNGFPILAEGLRSDNSVQMVDISRNAIHSVEAFPALGKILQENKNIKALDLSGIQMNDEDIKEIAQGLASNKSLIALNLYEAQISDYGAQELAKALEIILLCNF